MLRFHNNTWEGKYLHRICRYHIALQMLPVLKSGINPFSALPEQVLWV